MTVDPKQVNSLLDTITLKLEALFKKAVGAIKIPNPLKFLLNQESAEEALKNAPDPSTNWDRLGLSKTWWAFILLVVVIFAQFFRTGIDVIYRIAMFVVDSWVAFAFIFVAILLLKMLNVWNPILTAILNFLSKFKSSQ
jgi:hypothetical protein